MSLQKKLPSPFSKFRRFNERPGASVSKYKYQKFTGTVSREELAMKKSSRRKFKYAALKEW